MGAWQWTLRHAAYLGMRGCPPTPDATPFLTERPRACPPHRDPARSYPIVISLANA
jgi:hypothetical protein